MPNFKLPRLQQGWENQPKLLERYWDIAMTQLEKTLNAILDIPSIEAALISLNTATQNAQNAANNANSAASAVTSETSLVNSYPSNFTAPLISADSLGNVTIVNHNRVYGDSVINPTVSVIGATLTTAATPLSIVRIYYVDPARTGGAVSYLFTIDPTIPFAQTGNIHSVGAVEIPTAGSQDGNSLHPPGYVEL
jgi:hypothetical protein